MRRDTIFIIATINKKSSQFEMRKRQPRSLLPNQVCIPIHVEINEEDWFDRFEDVRVLKLKPPAKPTTGWSEMTFGKTTTENVIDRLAGR